MKGFVRFAVNVGANVCVLALCPFLVVAWVVRVRLHERAHRRGRALPQPRIAVLTDPKPAWTAMRRSAG
jgi:hypothetical protein